MEHLARVQCLGKRKKKPEKSVNDLYVFPRSVAYRVLAAASQIDSVMRFLTCACVRGVGRMINSIRSVRVWTCTNRKAKPFSGSVTHRKVSGRGGERELPRKSPASLPCAKFCPGCVVPNLIRCQQILLPQKPRQSPLQNNNELEMGKTHL